MLAPTYALGLTENERDIDCINTPESIVMFGYNGSGKGSQAKKLVREFGYAHLSSGDKLREISADPRTDLEQQIASEISQGILVSDDRIRELLGAFLRENEENPRIIIDGVVRKSSQRQMIDQMLSQRERQKPVALHVQVPREKAFAQIRYRAQVEGRADDAVPATINRRLDTYESTSLPALEEMRATGVEVLDIDGDTGLDATAATAEQIKQSIQTVFDRIVEAFAQR